MANLGPLDPDLTARDRLSPRSRYELLARIAAGGMGTVYLGRLRGPGGFERLVAIKRAHGHLARDAAFVKMFHAEARVASRLHHPNVVAVHDVEEIDGELVLVMDYVQGTALTTLLRSAKSDPLDPAIALRVLLDAAAGLHAAHELTNDDGRPLGLVHRDVSPENVLVGLDGAARIADFGVAKCARATIVTDGGELRGKLAYMAPECVNRGRVDARADVFALGVVAWESLAGERLFRGANEVATLKRVLAMPAPNLRDTRPDVPQELDDVVQRALHKSADARWPSARAFADALEDAARSRGIFPASHALVGARVRACAGDKLDARHRAIHARPEDARARAAGAADEPAEASEAMRFTASVSRRTASIADVAAAARAEDALGSAPPSLARASRELTVPPIEPTLPSARAEGLALPRGPESSPVVVVVPARPSFRGRFARVAPAAVGVALALAVVATGLGLSGMGRAEAPAGGRASAGAPPAPLAPQRFDAIPAAVAAEPARALAPPAPPAPEPRPAEPSLASASAPIEVDVGALPESRRAAPEPRPSRALPARAERPRARAKSAPRDVAAPNPYGPQR